MSLLHTIVPYEKIFESELNKGYAKSISEEITFKGVVLRGRRQKNNQFIIDRVISTDPKAYLDASLSPGSIINPQN